MKINNAWIGRPRIREESSDEAKQTQRNDLLLKNLSHPVCLFPRNIYTHTHTNTNLAEGQGVKTNIPGRICRVGLVQGRQLNRANEKEDLNLAQEGHAGQGLERVALRVDISGEVNILLDHPSEKAKHGHTAVLELSGADVLEVGHLLGRKEDKRKGGDGA